MVAHRRGCTREADTFDAHCQRCQEMSKIPPLRPGPTPEELDEQQRRRRREDRQNAVWTAGCGLVSFGVVVGLVLGALYLLVRFVKFAWTH